MQVLSCGVGRCWNRVSSVLYTRAMPTQIKHFGIGSKGADLHGKGTACLAHKSREIPRYAELEFIKCLNNKLFSIPSSYILNKFKIKII